MRYKITYQENNKIKTEKVAIDSYTDIMQIKENIIYIDQGILHNKQSLSSISKEEVLQLFSQFSLMLDSGLTFIQAIEIIQERNSKKQIEQILQSIKEAVVKSLPIEQLLFPYKKYLGNTPIIFLKLGIENGNMKESMNSLVAVLKEELSIKKQFFQVIRYPLLLVVSLVIALGMIFIYVLPNFEFIFQNLRELPIATKVLLVLKKIFSEYFGVLLIGILGSILFCMILYKKYPIVSEKVIFEQIPFISKIVRFYHLYKLFLAMGIIVRSKYQFQVAIQNSKVIIENRYLQELIDKVIQDIKQGNSIVHSFAKYKCFDEVTIKLLTTAQNTSRYETILVDIAHYYKVNFENSIQNFENYFEPIMILIIASVVLWLVIAIMVPIWDMGSLAL